MNPTKVPTLSIIVPVLNEAGLIQRFLNLLQAHSSSNHTKEIIVVDGGSTDNTVALVAALGIKIIEAEQGRARQMNAGAQHATGEILYFLHADTRPPAHFDQTIVEAVSQGYKAGCFQMKFDSTSPFLRFFAWFSRINHHLCRGGDQSLFIRKDLFLQTGGFNERYRVFEDNEFTSRLYGITEFRVVPQQVLTSARRYQQRGMLPLQYHFAVMHFKNFLGAGPEQLQAYYQKNIAR